MPRWLRSAVTALTITLAGLSGAACVDRDLGETASPELLAALEETTYIREGGGGMVIYVVVDTECPSCTELRRAAADEPTPNIEWRWVPVAYLGDEARAGAIDWLDAERRLDDAAEAVDANTETAQAAGIPQVPRLVYEDPDGEIRSLTGGGPHEVRQLQELAAEMH